MKGELISVIVPVYNVDKYLERCLDSIINQTYNNLEIILIDDGSTDKSAKICDVYKNKDQRIVVIHKKNEGVSSARNYGLKIAHGNYVGFVDSDDYINSNMYEILYANFLKYNVDISMCNYNIIKQRTVDSRYHENLKNDDFIIENKEQFYKMLNQFYFKGFLWNKLFKKDNAKKIGFRSDISFCEDLLFVAEYAQACNTFCYYKKPLYNYVIRESSAIRSKISLKTLSVIKAYEEIIKILNKFAKDEVIEYKYSEMLWFIKVYNELKKERKKLKKKYTMLYKEIMRSNLSIKKKCNVFIRKNFYYAYKITNIVYHAFDK